MSSNFEDTKALLIARITAERAVVAAAKKVHKRVTSKYRTQRCVLELKAAVEALEKCGG